MHRWNHALRQALLAMSALLVGCGSAGYAVDSATSACQQNPHYCAAVAGEEAVVPAAAIRGGTVAATLWVLTRQTRSDIEQALVECVEWANTEVNRERFGGKSPSRKQCQEALPGTDRCGKKVTRAMHLGKEKHALARQCTETRLGGLIPGRFSLDQRYRADQQTGQKQLVSREEEQALRQHGCGDELEGTIAPDVVISTRATRSRCWPSTISSFPARSAILPGGRSTREAPPPQPPIKARPTARCWEWDPTSSPPYGKSSDGHPPPHNKNPCGARCTRAP